MLVDSHPVRGRVAALRLVAAATALALFSTLGASCVDLLGLGGYTGAIQSLCDMLAECYGTSFYPKCVERAEQRLGDASPELRESYLTAFADNSCLESCTNARACLDHQPICSTGGSSCGAAEQCCGFTDGASQCSGDSCCAPRGSVCSDAGQCCDADCINGTCGGVECKDANESCNNDGECCGELVCGSVEQACVLCLPQFSECAGPSDCCSGNCVLDIVEPAAGGEEPPPALGFCDEATCAREGMDCNTPADCCSTAPFCAPVPALPGLKVCSPGECVPLGTPCLVDAACCSGVCDLNLGLCASECGPLGSECALSQDCCEGECPQGSCCLTDGLPCLDEPECCGGTCFEGTCTGSSCKSAGDSCDGDPLSCCSHYCSDSTLGTCCPVFANYCNHGVCNEGAPLRPDCGAIVINNGPEFGGIDCISSICTLNPDCCCLGWDQSCIDMVSDMCPGTGCAIPN